MISRKNGKRKVGTFFHSQEMLKKKRRKKETSKTFFFFFLSSGFLIAGKYPKKEKERIISTTSITNTKHTHNKHFCF